MSGNRYFKEIALVSTVVYSIIYGVLEYFAFHSPNYNGALKISKYFPNMYFYWTFMLLTAVGITFVFCRNWISVFWSMLPIWDGKWEAMLMYRFPFPVSNWYDDAFLIAKFTRLGQATLFWPFVPRFYYILPLIYLLGRFIPIFGSKMKNFLK